jgi:hypothetical protein
MEQVVAYKVVDKIQLKHLYLVYCISNATAEKKKEDFCLPFVNRCLCGLSIDHYNKLSTRSISFILLYLRAYSTNTDLIT